MKLLKIALVATLVACTVISMGADAKFKEKPKKCVHIVYAKAVTDPGLVMDMYKQLDPSFLKKPQPLYLVEVTHENVVYRILGSYSQWESFFHKKWQYATAKKAYDTPGR